MPSLIKIRRDTAANWSSVNPVLSNGEPGYDTTNNKIRIGNGTDNWNDLTPITAEANTGNIGFVDDRIYNINGPILSNDDLVHGATARLSIPEYGDTVNPISLYNNYGNFSILLGPSGTITNSWTFNNNGTLTLPAGGDILDSTGTSVLGTNGLPDGTRIVNPPSTSQGANGDLAGDIAFDVNAVYFCKQNYTFVPPTIVTVVAVDGNTVWIDDADRAGLDTDFVSISGTWKLRNGETDYTITSVTSDIQYDGSFALELGTTPSPAFNVYSDYNLYQPTGVNIWVKSNWASTGSW